MTTPRADSKAADTPPKKPASAPRAYEISLLLKGAHTAPPARPATYERQGIVSATSAAGAIRSWCEQQGEKFTGGTVRAVPTGYITETTVEVKTVRQLTLGAP